jgi:hypothetical protein
MPFLIAILIFLTFSASASAQEQSRTVTLEGKNFRVPAQGGSSGAKMSLRMTPVMNCCNKEHNKNGRLCELGIVTLQKMYGAK